MTAAICLRCGADKFGALTPCPKCEFTPHSDTEQAQSILLSDHFFSRTELQSNSELIRSGETISFSDDQIAAITDVTSGTQLEHGSNKIFSRLLLLLLTLWGIAAILILAYVDIRWLRAATAGLFFVTIFPTIVLWADILGPLRRICRACKKRGVTQGTTKLFESNDNYDEWNFCRNCNAVYLQVNGQWIAQSEPKNPS